MQLPKAIANAVELMPETFTGELRLEWRDGILMRIVKDETFAESRELQRHTF
jgi:hypothetical protein